MPDSHEREIIEAGSRRKGLPPGGRAEAPQRRRPVGPGGCGLLLFLILVGGYFMLYGGGLPGSGPPVDQEQYYEPALQEPAPEGFTPSATGEDANTWLVMLYLDADDQVLEKDIFIDLNEAERVGSSGNVHIVAQIDRFRSAFNGDGDWTSTHRYYVTRDEDLNRINSQLISDLGEADMADGNSLVSFVTWAVTNIQADRYVLILSDHGMGWPGGWSDPDPGVNPPSEIPLVSRLGAYLYLMELDEALGVARQQAGIEKFDLIGLDACLMAQIEVLAALQPHTRYAVFSEEVEPSLGWAYAGFLGPLIADPSMTTEDFSKLIVGSYIRQDVRLSDPEAREEYLGGGSAAGGIAGNTPSSLEALIEKLEHGATLSAVDLEYYPALMDSFNNLAYALQGEDQALVARARGYSQSYTSVFGRQVPPAYIDLGHFAALLERESNDSTLRSAASDLMVILRKAVVAEKHGPGKPGSSGIAVYFPNSTLYSSPITGPQSYTGVASRFAEASLWDDFLAFHYQERTFRQQDAQRVVPAPAIPVRVPGQGSLAVSSLTGSPTVTRAGSPVRLSVDIRGQNIGYIYLFVGFYDRNTNSIYVADTDYLESPSTRQVNSAFYPAWSRNSAFTLAFNWEPVVFAISDGSTTTPALFTPLVYGASYEEAVYAVDGLYTFYHTGDTQDARMLFRNGSMLAVYGFNGKQVPVAPHEITPQAGDRFTLLDKWMNLDSEGGVKDVDYQPGETLTFGDDPLTWEVLEAAPGEYLIGFLIEDLDGNTYPVFTQIFVQ